MAEGKKELEVLFGQIKRSLKIYTVKELNKALESVIIEKSDNQKHKAKKIAIIINTICSHYKIKKIDLIYGKDKTIQEPKIIAFCILHINLSLTIRYIANKIFFLKWHNTVGLAIKYYNALDTNILQDRVFLEKYNKINEEVNNQINRI